MMDLMLEECMLRAIDLAKKGSGFVNPNPLVGAVIVKDEKIIGEGYYRAKDAEAAEVMAIKSVLSDLKDSHLVINIEPLAENIIVAGIKKVSIGYLHPIYKGKEVDRLRATGIEVEINILKEKCEELNEISNCYLTTGIPFVFTKWAMTLDGKLASRTGDSKWISGEESLEFVHHLRQRVAAIMVGENTVRLDDPLLTTRLEDIKISNPLRVILSRYGDISETAKVLKVDENTKTLIIASDKIDKTVEASFLRKGVQVLKLAEINGKIDFKSIVEELGYRGIDSLYIEGGSGVLGAAFESGVVKKVYTAIAPKIIGGKDAITPVGGIGIEKMKDAIVLKRVTHEIVGTEVIFKGYIED